MKNDFMINSSLEFGLRALVILIKMESVSVDIDELLVFDYVLTNSSDFSKELPSIHISTSYKYSKLYTKRGVLKQGLIDLSIRGLIDVMYDEKGISYKSNKFSEPFIRKIESSYKDKLLVVAEWLSKEVEMNGFSAQLDGLKRKVIEEKIYFYSNGGEV